jgi:hypothetical protein
MAVPIWCKVFVLPGGTMEAKHLFRQTFWLMAIFLALAPRAFAAASVPTDSLFFTPDETKQIEALANKNGPRNSSQSDIHLGAVMYYGPGNWTLWLQGERWTPETVKADLHVLDVQPDAVRLTLTATPDMTTREITLRPHQTYRIATGQVVEGEAW